MLAEWTMVLGNTVSFSFKSYCILQKVVMMSTFLESSLMPVPGTQPSAHLLSPQTNQKVRIHLQVCTAGILMSAS